MNRGPAGAIALNEALQAALNPRGDTLVRGARSYRVGDKSMQLRNDYDRNIFNGDVGSSTSIDPEEMTPHRPFRRKRGTFEQLGSRRPVLAYACTVHKSQGSEYPAVVLPLLTTHFVMLSQEPALHGRHPRQAPGRPGLRPARPGDCALAAPARERRTRLASRLMGPSA